MKWLNKVRSLGDKPYYEPLDLPDAKSPAPADMFAVGQVPAPHAVRISLAPLRDDEDLARGLDVLAELMNHTPQPRRASL